MSKQINMEEVDPSSQQLIPDHERFCQLYVCGGVAFAGQLNKCYMEVFGENNPDMAFDARELVRQPHIMARIKDLMAPLQSETEVMALKMQLTETLRSIMEETASRNFNDKYGAPLSPAPLRAVSVNAAKALMELYPVKHAHETKLRIEGSDGGIVFNVIAPQTSTADGDTEEP